jgi:hypothetical protein
VPAGRSVWVDVAKYLKISNVDIRIWLGDMNLDNSARELFPDCNVESFFDVNKAILKERKINFTPGKNILLNPKFFILKDKVYKIMDRQDDERKYGRLEREAVFYELFNYYYDMIVCEEIDVLIASEAPHSTVGMILYGICEILDIPRYHMMEAGVAPLLHVCRDFYGDTVDVSRGDRSSTEIYKPIFEEYVESFEKIPEEPLYMVLQKKYDIKKNKMGVFKYLELLLKGIKYSRGKRLNNSYVINTPFFKVDNKRSIFSRLTSNRLHTQLENAYMGNVSEIQPDIDYVYYPLHYEPERTSNPDGGLFYQAYDSLMALRAFIPLDIPIYVKEHYSQFTRMLPGYRGKSPYLYDVLASLPNVHLVDPEIKSETLVRNALLTASQTGTACIEAACFEKKAILMGDTWFSGTPNVHDFNELSSFDSLMAKPIDTRKKVLESMIRWIDNKAIPGCVNPSSEEYFRQKFKGDEYSAMFDNSVMAKQYVDTILADLSKRLT